MGQQGVPTYRRLYPTGICVITLVESLSKHGHPFTMKLWMAHSPTSLSGLEITTVSSASHPSTGLNSLDHEHPFPVFGFGTAFEQYQHSVSCLLNLLLVSNVLLLKLVYCIVYCVLRYSKFICYLYCVHRLEVSAQDCPVLL